MNQIIFPEKIENNLINYKKEMKKIKKIYKFLFIFSILAALSFSSYYFFLYLKISKKDKISEQILEVYDIQQLYASATPVDLPSIILENGESAEILGIIEIEKINLRYPILSKTTDDFLKIAPCKFAGNKLNGIGNFCIAGHNYDNNELFSNLKLLDIGDMISIYTLNGNSVYYIIYDKYETTASNISCIEQNTKNKELTLYTCTNNNNKRLIIKAKENR